MKSSLDPEQGLVPEVSTPDQEEDQTAASEEEEVIYDQEGNV